MRQKAKNILKKMHWTSKLIIKLGSVSALCLLLAGFFFPRFSENAIALGQSAVYSFAVSVIGGLLLDVVAERMGLRSRE